MVEEPGTQVEATDGSRRVRELVRFGWAVAELRGRVRLGAGDAAEPPGLAAESRRDHALPLSSERSWLEQFHELVAVVEYLAETVGPQDLVAGDIDSSASPGHHDQGAAEWVTDLARGVDQNDDSTWQRFAEALYRWDATIQDHLAQGSFGEASAYQLGRGVGDMTWALKPGARPSDMDSWDFLLGEERALALIDLVRRLGPNFHPLTSRAIEGSIAAWHRVAGDSRWRSKPEAARLLRRQARLWRDLLVTGRDPAELVGATAVGRRARVMFRLIGTLWSQILVFAGGALLLSFGAHELSQPHKSGTALHVFATAFGAIGITAAGVSAKVQSSARSLLKTVQSEYYASLVIDGITYTPEPPVQLLVRGKVTAFFGGQAVPDVGTSSDSRSFFGRLRERHQRVQYRRANGVRLVHGYELETPPASLPNGVYGFEEIFAVNGLQDRRALFKASNVAPDGHSYPIEVHRVGGETLLIGYMSNGDAQQVAATGDQWVRLWMRRTRAAPKLVHVPVTRIAASQSQGDGSSRNEFRLLLHLVDH